MNFSMKKSNSGAASVRSRVGLIQAMLIQTIKASVQKGCYVVIGLAFLYMNSGCSGFMGDHGYFRDRSMDYQDAKVVDTIEVVTAKPVRPIQEKWVVPKTNGHQYFQPEGFKDVPRQRAVTHLTPNGEISLLRLDNEDRIIIAQPFNMLLPTVQNFWEQKSINLTPVATVVGGEKRAFVTDWITGDQLQPKKGFIKSTLGVVKDSLSFRDQWHRYLLVFEQQEDQGRVATQLVIAHQLKKQRSIPGLTSIKLSDKEGPHWESRGTNSQSLLRLRSTLTEYVYARLYASTEVAEDEQRPTEAHLTKDGNGYPVLHLSQEFPQAWVLVGRALNHSNIKLDDWNRSLAIYYLNLAGDRRFNSMKAQDQSGSEQPGYFELKISQTDSGVQLALQKNDDTLAEKAIAMTLFQQLVQVIE